MNSQIDEKLENILNLNEINDKEMEKIITRIPKDNNEYLSILKNLRNHIRTQGRKSRSLEDYIQKVKKKYAKSK